MPLRDTLQTILTEYAEARRKPFAGHALAEFVRHGAAEAVKDALGELGAGLVVEGKRRGWQLGRRALDFSL